MATRSGADTGNEAAAQAGSTVGGPILGAVLGGMHLGELYSRVVRGVPQVGKERRQEIRAAGGEAVLNTADVADGKGFVDDQDLGLEVRGDGEVQKRDPKALPATEKDWRTEYLAPVISVATVDGGAYSCTYSQRPPAPSGSDWYRSMAKAYS